MSLDEDIEEGQVTLHEYRRVFVMAFGVVVLVMGTAVVGVLLAVSAGQQPETYPVRVALPTSSAVELQELEALAEEDESLSEIVEEQREAVAEAEQLISSTSRSDTGFSQAFGDLAGSPLAQPQTNESGFLEMDYDLATLEPAAETYNRSDNSLTVEKPLFVDGVSSGAATIRIEEGAQILIATSSVARALGDKANALPKRISGAIATGSGFIPFYELRGVGIDVAYDPVNDRVSLSMPT